MSGALLIGLTMIIPLVGALLILMSDGKPNQRESVTIVTAMALFAVNVLLLLRVLNGEAPTLHIVETVEGVPIAIADEPIGLMLGMVGS